MTTAVASHEASDGVPVGDLRVARDLTYFADRHGLIYWTFADDLRQGDALRVVLSYVPVGSGTHAKCVVHGYGFELDGLPGWLPPVARHRLTELQQRDDKTGDQYLSIPRDELVHVFEPVGVDEAQRLGLIEQDVLKALTHHLDEWSIDEGSVRFYGRVACGLRRRRAASDIDIVLDGANHRERVQNAVSRRSQIDLLGLDPFFTGDDHRMAAVKRRWSLSQMVVPVHGCDVPVDVKVVAGGDLPRDATRYFDASWGRVEEVHDVEVRVDDASLALSPAPLVWGWVGGERVSVSSMHYMFSGLATEGDTIRVTGVRSGDRIALVDPVKHHVVPDLPQEDRFVPPAGPPAPTPGSR